MLPEYFSSDDLGTYGYYNSIVTYFILLATLGVANCKPEISGNRKTIRKNLWNLYFSLDNITDSLYFALSHFFVNANPVAYI